ncbi:hypothetical protein [Blastococcus sp. SYSU DS0541]
MPLWQDVEGRLTPEARQVLEELVEDLRKQVLLSATRRAFGDTIAVRDVVEAFRGETRLEESQKPRRARLYERAALVYLLVALLGLILGVYVNFSSTFPSTFALTVIVSASSTLVASLVLFALSRRVTRRRMEESLARRGSSRGVNEFLAEWIDVESSVRLGAATLLGSSVSGKPVRQLVRDLEKAGFLSDSEVAAFSEVAAYRNDLVHGIVVNESSIREALAAIERIRPALNRLQRQ